MIYFYFFISLYLPVMLLFNAVRLNMKKKKYFCCKFLISTNRFRVKKRVNLIFLKK